MKGGYREGREIKTDGDGDGEGGGEVSARDERWKEWGGREGGRGRDMEGVKMRGRDRGRERGWRGRGGKRQRGADNEFRQKRSQDI